MPYFRAETIIRCAKPARFAFKSGIRTRRSASSKPLLLAWMAKRRRSNGGPARRSFGSPACRWSFPVSELPYCSPLPNNICDASATAPMIGQNDVWSIWKRACGDASEEVSDLLVGRLRKVLVPNPDGDEGVRRGAAHDLVNLGAQAFDRIRGCDRDGDDDRSGTAPTERGDRDVHARPRR